MQNYWKNNIFNFIQYETKYIYIMFLMIARQKTLI